MAPRAPITACQCSATAWPLPLRGDRPWSQQPSRLNVVVGVAVDASFWEQRWRRGETGFHLEQVNPLLPRYWPVLGLAPGSSVLVPLCGKSLDLIWLRDRGHSVVGIELSRQAVEAFAAEHGEGFKMESRGAMSRYRVAGVTILQGDLFDVDREAVGDIHGLYDRGALVALPKEMRQGYVNALAVLAPRATCLLVTVEYDQTQMAGPPFSVSEPEVRALYGPDLNVEVLAREEVIDQEPRFRARGLDSMRQCVYRIGRGLNQSA